MIVWIMMILNISNLPEDQIVYSQTVIDTLNVRYYPSAIVFIKQQQVLLVPNYSIEQIRILTTVSKYILRGSVWSSLD
jgi:hypothetical protein